MVVQTGGGHLTIYVFDSGPLIDLFSHYYRERFPSLWQNFDGMVAAGRITSTREVGNEIEGYGDKLAEWLENLEENRKNVFATPTSAELEVVRQIFDVRHFQSMIRKRQLLEGRPVADPFVIARAKCLNTGCVVTTEKHTPNAAKIPNVCEYFDVDWTDLEGFMEREQWRF